MTKCEHIPLLEFLHADLDVGETSSIVQHVEACAVCRERLQIMATLETAYDDRSLTVAAPRRPKIKLWLLAACLVLAVSVPLLYKDDSLATKEKYPYFPLQTRSQAFESGDLKSKAFESYVKNDFETAERLFAKFPSDGEMQFYRGVSLYLLGEHLEALQSLTKAEKLDSRWHQPSLWYQAHTFLKMGQKEKAKQAFSRLSHEDSSYQRNAQELLRKLK